MAREWLSMQNSILMESQMVYMISDTLKYVLDSLAKKYDT